MAEPYKTEEIQSLYDDAQSYYDDISDNAQQFLNDIEEKLKFAVDEGVGNIMLTEKQHGWLKSIANGDANLEHGRW